MKTQSQSLIDMVITTLHVADYTSEQQEQLLDKFSAILFEDLMSRFVSHMPTSNHDEFYSLLDQDISEEKLMEFIQKHVSDVDVAIQEALKDFNEEVLAASDIEIH